MTEKRFTLSTTEFDGTLSFYDAECDCETRMSTEYVLDKVEITLNALHEENDALKQQLKTKYIVNKQYEELQRMKKENKELKQELAIYRKVASCSNCNYHNYDWYDDGDEFEVCDKGNDVTDGICEEWVEL